MARGMYKGPNKAKWTNEKMGSNRLPVIDPTGKSPSEKRLSAYQTGAVGNNTKTVMHEPGSQKK